MRRKAIFSAVLALATGATFMIAGQSFAASGPSTAPREATATAAPRGGPADQAEPSARTRRQAKDTAAPKAGPAEPSDASARTRRQTKPKAVPDRRPVTGRGAPAEAAAPVRATPRFTG